MLKMFKLFEKPLQFTIIYLFQNSQEKYKKFLLEDFINLFSNFWTKALSQVNKIRNQNSTYSKEL